MNLVEHRSLYNRLSDKVRVRELIPTHLILPSIIDATRRCRNSFEKSDSIYDQFNNTTDRAEFILGKKDEGMLKHCIDNGHHSVFEHVIFSFEIQYSRVAQLQHVRHRLSSFSAESARACKVDKFYTPLTIQQNQAAIELYSDTIEMVKGSYEDLIGFGIPIEDARYILPNAQESMMIYTANLSSLRHAIAERTCIHAQKEIRDVFETIKSYLKGIHPVLVYRTEKINNACTENCGYCTKGK